MRKWQSKAILATGLLFAGMLGTQMIADAQAADDVVIGIAAPFTGSSASVGEQFRRGATLAVENINKAGGVLGRKLILDFQDDASNPTQGVAIANKLASAGVGFVVGHFNSSVSIPASDVYSEAGMLQISPGSTNVMLTSRGERYNMLFRACGRDDQQGQMAGSYILKNYSGKNIAIIHDQTTYGKGLADEVMKAIETGGMKTTIYQGVAVGDKDFAALITRMRQAKIDVMYFGGLYAEAGLLIRQSREQGLQAQLLSGDGLSSDTFGTIAGPASDGVLSSDAPDQRDYPTAKAVVEQYRAQSYEPEGYTLRTYASVQIIIEAATRAKSLKPADVAKEMHKSQPFPTVIGDIAFDKNGDLATSDYVFFQWKDGKRIQIR